MKLKRKRLPPLVLTSPHEAAPEFHEDLTIVPGAARDPELFEKELRLRAQRNRLIHENLVAGSAVWYKSSGNSMWPLVQSGDAVTLHPIQAVTADDGVQAIPKEASEIGVGDIVFCQVQRSNQYYTHIVLMVQRDYHTNEAKYWIGNLEHRLDGWCFREHIYGILRQVEAEEEYCGGAVWGYYARPFPKRVFYAVQELVDGNRWSLVAGQMCNPE